MTGAFPPPGSTTQWAGRAVTNARTWYAQQITWPTPCARCGQPITPDYTNPYTGKRIVNWHLGHRADRQAHPELTWEPKNWAPEHVRCSTSSGTTRRLRELALLGWSLRGLAADLGLDPGTVHDITNGIKPRVRRATALAVLELHRRRGGTPGPSARTRAWALARFGDLPIRKVA
jgi:hypothetical protein